MFISIIRFVAATCVYTHEKLFTTFRVSSASIPIGISGAIAPVKSWSYMYIHILSPSLYRRLFVNSLIKLGTSSNKFAVGTWNLGVGVRGKISRRHKAREEEA